MGKKTRKLRSPKYAKKCAKLRETVLKMLKISTPSDPENEETRPSSVNALKEIAAKPAEKKKTTTRKRKVAKTTTKAKTTNKVDTKTKTKTTRRRRSKTSS